MVLGVPNRIGQATMATRTVQEVLSQLSLVQIVPVEWQAVEFFTRKFRKAQSITCYSGDGPCNNARCSITVHAYGSFVPLRSQRSSSRRVFSQIYTEECTRTGNRGMGQESGGKLFNRKVLGVLVTEYCFRMEV
jgi:hypothetical protein